jgi:hypothetical protein
MRILSTVRQPLLLLLLLLLVLLLLLLLQVCDRLPVAADLVAVQG